MFSSRLCISLLILFLQTGLYAQMPGWATIRDRDGNTYFVDRNFKLHTTGDPGPEYKPVSLDGLEYYLDQSDSLIKNHHIVESLRILKGIKILSTLDTRATGAGLRASKTINNLIRREKERYVRHDHDSALFLIRHNAVNMVYNDWMNWSFSTDGMISVLSRKSLEQYGYARDGVSFGIRFDKKNEKGFDTLLTVNCEEFKYKMRLVKKYIELTRNKSAEDTFTRTVLEENDTRIVYKYSGGGPERYAGLELFIVHGFKGYHVQTFSPEASYAGLEKNLGNLAAAFSVKGGD
jgi:hypothetical protein